MSRLALDREIDAFARGSARWLGSAVQVLLFERPAWIPAVA
jgi:hypothetical protein